MIRTALWIGLTLALMAFVPPAAVQAQRSDNKTVLTFSQPVEIPGHVLPAGTYTFKLMDSLSDRHIVQVFSADGSKIIATVMAIPNSRLTATDETVIRFREVPRGSPEAIRAWFYPGNTGGQEFVYPKPRALQLARAAKAVVPAVNVDVSDLNALKTAPIVAITPDEKEVPVTAAIQTTPAETAAAIDSKPSSTGAATGVTQAAQNAPDARRLPQTASVLPMVILFGFSAIMAGLGMMVLNGRVANKRVAL